MDRSRTKYLKHFSCIASVTVTGGRSAVEITALIEGTDIAQSSRKIKFDEKGAPEMDFIKASASRTQRRRLLMRDIHQKFYTHFYSFLNQLHQN